MSATRVKLDFASAPINLIWHAKAVRGSAKALTFRTQSSVSHQKLPLFLGSTRRRGSSHGITRRVLIAPPPGNRVEEVHVLACSKCPRDRGALTITHQRLPPRTAVALHVSLLQKMNGPRPSRSLSRLPGALALQPPRSRAASPSGESPAAPETRHRRSHSTTCAEDFCRSCAMNVSS